MKENSTNKLLFNCKITVRGRLLQLLTSGAKRLTTPLRLGVNFTSHGRFTYGERAPGTH
jgi:hypothetical protein